MKLMMMILMANLEKTMKKCLWFNVPFKSIENLNLKRPYLHHKKCHRASNMLSRWLKSHLRSTMLKSLHIIRIQKESLNQRNRQAQQQVALELLTLHLLWEVQDHLSNWCRQLEIKQIEEAMLLIDWLINKLIFIAKKILVWDHQGHHSKLQIDLKKEELKSKRKCLTFLVTSSALALTHLVAWVKDPNQSTSRRKRKDLWTFWLKRLNVTMWTGWLLILTKKWIKS